MKNFFEKFLNRKWILGISGAFLIIIGYWIFGKSDTEMTMETMVVERKDLLQEVSITGTVQATQEVELSFGSGGEIDFVNVALGETVEAGQILASLDNGSAASQVANADAGVRAAESQLKVYQASLDAEEARLDALKNGASEAEIAVAEVKVQNAEVALADAQNNLTVVTQKAEIDLENLMDDIPDLIYESYSIADDAVRIQTDSLFNNERVDPSQVPNE